MLDYLLSVLPTWAQDAVLWSTRTDVLAALSVGSAVLFVLNVVGIPWFFARVPADYFSRRELERAGFEAAPPGVLRFLLRVLKNVLGVVLLVAGLAMLVLPGQGILTLFVATVLLDFPGKRRLQRRFIRWPPVLKTINRLRSRAGRPPLTEKRLTHPGE